MKSKEVMDASRLDSILPEFSAQEKLLLSRALPFTMTSPERMAALMRATEYVVRNRIPGDFAECGVWRGGSMMVVALTLQALGDCERQLYLYDTFEGMSEPTQQDRDFHGNFAESQLKLTPRGTGVWCEAGLEDVQQNLRSTGYPFDRIAFVRGKVEETIPSVIPDSLALLRLDTDWYESTKHELEHMYPRLNKHGILVIDDYGHWVGARQAVDEYFAVNNIRGFLHRVDYTGRIMVKIES